jgi:CRISPR-associated protein Cas2
MMVIITYDVSTTSVSGPKRLRRVAKTCEKFGQRVQNSVFECVVDATQFTQLKHDLLSIIDESHDSIRFYRLGNNYDAKIEHYGVKTSFDVEGVLIL